MSEALSVVVPAEPAGEEQPAAPRPRRPLMRQYELVERVKAYDPDADEDLLNRAYVFAMKAHGAQLRASGDPYFHHPVEVAGILTGLRLDIASIATALLHDTVEDTGATLDEIERLFGPVVARLVDGVTKLNKLELQSAQTAQAENFRKLLLAMSDDIRVLLVKLADRLHNMRTLQFIKNPDKRRRIAAETMEIYAPLAERIGMEGLTSELQDLAFAELSPDIRAGILHRLRPPPAGRRGPRRPGLRRPAARAGRGRCYGRGHRAREDALLHLAQDGAQEHQLRAALGHHGVPRPRRLGRRAATRRSASVHGAYHTLPGRFKDYISTPKSNGYRSLHTTIIGPERRKIEVQIRTARDARAGRARRRRALGLQAGTPRSPRAGSTAGSASCWTSWSTPAGPRSSSRTPSSRCSRTRCSASRPRAT